MWMRLEHAEAGTVSLTRVPAKKSECGFKIFSLLLSAVYLPVDGTGVELWHLAEASFNEGFILKKILAEEKGRVNEIS